jgi:hypothetical protein
MNYCTLIADLIIFLAVKFDRLTLIANYNRSRFLKVILLFLVDIIADILDNHRVFLEFISIFLA